MFSRPKILFLVSLLFVALLNSIPTYLLNFLIFYHSSIYYIMDNSISVHHLTPSELDEIRCVGSPGGHVCPKGISLPLLVWLPQNGSIFAVSVTIQSIISWAIFIVLKNELHHFKAQRISFHLIYLAT